MVAQQTVSWHHAAVTLPADALNGGTMGKCELPTDGLRAISSVVGIGQFPCQYVGASSTACFLLSPLYGVRTH